MDYIVNPVVKMRPHPAAHRSTPPPTGNSEDRKRAFTNGICSCVLDNPQFESSLILLCKKTNKEKEKKTIFSKGLKIITDFQACSQWLVNPGTNVSCQ